MYVNYAARDNWNFDAQDRVLRLAGRAAAASPSTWTARPPRPPQPPYFRAQHPRAYRWLAAHLLPPTDPLPPPAP